MNARIALMLGLLVTAVAGFGFYTVGLKPKREEAATLQTSIEQQQQALSSAQQLLASNEQARRDYRKSYASVIRLGKAVPADDDVRSLVVQIEESAKKAGIDFSSINLNTTGGAAVTAGATDATQLPPGATVGTAGFPVMQFSFKFTGPFFNLGDFFKRVQGFVKTTNDKVSVTGRLISVDTLKLEPDTNGFPRIAATVAATTYIVSPLEGLTAGATAAGPAGATAPAATTDPAAAATPAGSTAAAADISIPNGADR